jgi:hypothetical protein
VWDGEDRAAPQLCVMNEMEQNILNRLKLSKKILFIAWIIAVLGSFIALYYTIPPGNNDHTNVPYWAHIPFIAGSILMLVGVLLGSRGVGVPLSVNRLFSLVFGYPCWIPFLIYLTNMWVIPMIYYKFIR